VRLDQDAAVAAATVTEDAQSALLADLLGRVAGCFPRRETRRSCGQMVSGLLMQLEDHNCWTIAEAAGHRGPHRLQHLLSRAVWDEELVLDIAADWAVGHLDDGDAVLIVDETADEKSSAGAAGAARQYSGLEVTSDDTPEGHRGGHSVLLARRHRYTGKLSFYRCWTPGPVPLSRLIAVAAARWRVEEDHQLAKQSTGAAPRCLVAQVPNPLQRSRTHQHFGPWSQDRY